jgi:hypothetical protein
MITLSISPYSQASSDMKLSRSVSRHDFDRLLVILLSMEFKFSFILIILSDVFCICRGRVRQRLMIIIRVGQGKSLAGACGNKNAPTGAMRYK